MITVSTYVVFVLGGQQQTTPRRDTCQIKGLDCLFSTNGASTTLLVVVVKGPMAVRMQADSQGEWTSDSLELSTFAKCLCKSTCTKSGHLPTKFAVNYLILYVSYLWILTLKITCCVSCTGLQSFLDHEEIPVDVLIIKPHIKKDRRHASKPDTAYLLSSDNPSSLSMYTRAFSFVISHNPLIAVLFLFLLLLIVSPFLFIFLQFVMNHVKA